MGRYTPNSKLGLWLKHLVNFNSGRVFSGALGLVFWSRGKGDIWRAFGKAVAGSCFALGTWTGSDEPDTALWSDLHNYYFYFFFLQNKQH